MVSPGRFGKRGGACHAPSAVNSVLDALAERRLLVVSGKGGTGRTTLSALFGLALARRGRRVLVATTGHDDRLAWMLGAQTLPSTPLEVESGLLIQRVEPRICVREYGALVLGSRRLSGAVLEHAIVDRLLGAIPGLYDFAVLGKVWHEAVRARSFDAVVFDGPATGHLRLVLGLPDAILDAIPAGPLVGEARDLRASLRDDETSTAVLVGLPERWPLTELGELGGVLREEIGIGIGALVINGCWPADLPALGPAPPELSPAVEVVDAIGRRGRAQADEVARWRVSPQAARCAPEHVLEVPWRPDGLQRPEALERLLDELEG